MIFKTEEYREDSRKTRKRWRAGLGKMDMVVRIMDNPIGVGSELSFLELAQRGVEKIKINALARNRVGDAVHVDGVESGTLTWPKFRFLAEDEFFDCKKMFSVK